MSPRGSSPQRSAQGWRSTTRDAGMGEAEHRAASRSPLHGGVDLHVNPFAEYAPAALHQHCSSSARLRFGMSRCAYLAIASGRDRAVRWRRRRGHAREVLKSTIALACQRRRRVLVDCAKQRRHNDEGFGRRPLGARCSCAGHERSCGRRIHPRDNRVLAAAHQTVRIWETERHASSKPVVRQVCGLDASGSRSSRAAARAFPPS